MKADEYYQSLENSAFDVADLVAFLWLKKFRIAFVAIVITVLGAYHIYNLPKIYSASSTILLGDSKQEFSLSSAVSSFGGQQDTKFDTFMEFIRSRQFLSGVVEELGLAYDEEFRPKTPGTSEEYILEHAIKVMSENLFLSRLGETYLLKITFESKNPKTAAAVANHLGPAFFEFQSGMSRKRADDATTWLNQQLTELQDKLGEAENALQLFQRENQLIDVHSQIDLARTEISTLLREKLAVEKMLSEVRATATQIEMSSNNVEKLMQVSWILNNSLVADIRSKIGLQEQVLAELSKRYKSKHHRHIAAVTKLNTLRNERDELLRELSASIKQEYKMLKARSEDLTEQIDGRKSEHSELGRLEVQLVRLQREVDSTQSLYDTFVSRLQETEMLKDFGNTDEFAIVDYATVPAGPSKPRVALLTALVLMFSTIGSCGFWLILHIVSDRETRYRQLMHRLGVPILCEVPKLGNSRKTKNVGGVYVEGQKDYQFSEAIRSLRTSILVSPGEKEKRIILITSIGEHAGKSSVAVSLAESFSKMEKTLLIDNDLRTPSLAQAFKLKKGHPGLTDFIERRNKFSECISRIPDSQMTFMPSGPVPGDPVVYISNSRFAGIIQKLGILFDRMVIEAPAAHTFSDALILSKYVDGVVLVIEADSTESHDLIEGIQHFQDAGAPLLGVVFNKVKNVRNQVPHESGLRKLAKKVLRR